MKVLIVEDALNSLKGHWFQYISDLVSDGRKLGYDIEIAVPRDAAPEVLDRLPCHPILSKSLFGQKKDPASLLISLKRILGHNFSLYTDLRRFLDKGHSFDLIISTTTRVDHLFAYGFLFWRSPWNIRKLVLIFIDTIGTYSKDHSEINFSKKLLLLKFGMKLLRFLRRGNQLILATESEGVARQYRLLSGAELKLLPHVTVMPPMDSLVGNGSVMPADLSPALLFATYGFTRYDKGLDVLQEALKLRSELARSTQYRFVLQWTGDYQLPDGSWIRKDPLLAASPQVSYIPPFLDSNEYHEWIGRTNVMVLPYRRGFYHDRLSRVAIDAAMVGIPIVYPKGTWLESFAINQASGVGFDAEDPSSLADAIYEAISRYDELKSVALMRRSGVVEAFSAKTFFDTIASL
jgi:glycosyltransferase involved in cell wall biosynthesis